MLVPTLDAAIPFVKTLPECADFAKTVEPYIPQLYALPQQIYANIHSLDSLKTLYLTTNPLITSFFLAIFIVAPIALIAAEVNKNYSQIDRVWSILPVLYNSHYALWAHLSGLPTHKLDSVMAVSVLWGARLTFNYWRKGGYEIGSEDYRWVTVRQHAGKWMFLFDVLFISFGQSFLLFLITTPTYILLLTTPLTPAPNSPPTTYTLIFPTVIISLVAIEFLADNQQWAYHAAKAYYQRTATLPKPTRFTRHQLDLGFNTTGLFGWSRHPNFAAEQAVWVALYQWACCESFTLGNWTIAGAAGYLFLFQASTAFTEYISKGKYPEYKVYQERVGRFLPKAKTGSMEDVMVGAKKDGEKGEAKGSGNGGKGKARKR